MTDRTNDGPLTFLMVGCQRCGTTWIDAALRDHPEVYLPSVKQSYFFDMHYDLGIEWYKKLFQEVAPAHLAVGEIATGYCLVDVVPLVARHFPDIKVLMVVRNPVDRVWSNYQIRKQQEGWASVSQAIDTSPDLLERSRYAEQLELIQQYWNPSQVKVLFHEDLASDDRAYFRDICRFLAVDETIETTQFGQIKNSAMFPRVRRAANTVGLRPVLDRLSLSSIGNVIRRMKKQSGKRGYAAMEPDQRLKLISYFRPYNDRLSQMTGRDLSHWNR